MRLIYVIDGSAYSYIVGVKLYEQMILRYAVSGFCHQRINSVVRRYKINLIAEIFPVRRYIVGQFLKSVILFQIYSVVASDHNVLT